MISELWNLAVRYCVLLVVLVVIVGLGVLALLRLGFDRCCEWRRTEFDKGRE